MQRKWKASMLAAANHPSKVRPTVEQGPTECAVLPPSYRAMAEAPGQARVLQFMRLIDAEMRVAENTVNVPDMTLRFDIQGVGSWLITVAGGVGRVEDAARLDADGRVQCTVSTSLETLERVATGRIKPVLAVLSGKIAISGERSLFSHLRVPLTLAASKLVAAEAATPVAASRITARVKSHEVLTIDGVGRHVVYTLVVGESSPRSTVQWERSLRWSALRDVHRLLAKDHPGVKLPPLMRLVDYRKSFKAAHIARRSRHMERYLAQLLAAFPDLSLAQRRGPGALVDLLAPQGPSQAVPSPSADGSGDDELADLEAEIKAAQELPIPWHAEGSEYRNAVHQRLRTLEGALGVTAPSTADEEDRVLPLSKAALRAALGIWLVAAVALAATLAAGLGQSCPAERPSCVGYVAAAVVLALNVPLAAAVLALPWAGPSCRAFAGALATRPWDLDGAFVLSRNAFHDVPTIFGGARVAASQAPIFVALAAVVAAAVFAVRVWPLRRFWRIWATFAVTFTVYDSARRLLKLFKPAPALEASVYAALDAVIAPFVADHLRALGSLWVKMGQYLSGRSDVISPGWAHALRILQDDMPADRRAHVRRTIERELRVNMDDLFLRFDYRPLASASVVCAASPQVAPRPSPLQLTELALAPAPPPAARAHTHHTSTVHPGASPLGSAARWPRPRGGQAAARTRGRAHAQGLATCRAHGGMGRAQGPAVRPSPHCSPGLG